MECNHQQCLKGCPNKPAELKWSLKSKRLILPNAQPQTPLSAVPSQNSEDSGFHSTPSYDANGSRKILDSGEFWEDSYDEEWRVATSGNGIDINENCSLESPTMNDKVGLFASAIASQIVKESVASTSSMDWNIKCSCMCSEVSCQEDMKKKKKHRAETPFPCSSNLCWTPELPFNPQLNYTRKSSVSHDSLVRAVKDEIRFGRDDSRFIKEAVSHEALFTSSKNTTRKDFDIYSSPVDTLKPYQGRIIHPKAVMKQPKGRPHSDKGAKQREKTEAAEIALPQSKFCKIIPFLQKKKEKNKKKSSLLRTICLALFSFKRNPKEAGFSVDAQNDFIDASHTVNGTEWGKICPLPSAPSLKPSDCSAFRNLPKKSHLSPKVKKLVSPKLPSRVKKSIKHVNSTHLEEPSRTTRRLNGHRALPPLPPKTKQNEAMEQSLKDGCDFASIIEKVKYYGWYWGPISGEAAEKVLANEPDGSFIVRDSSDYHYIFSLTFRLNGMTRHVRIEHDQGNFSFGGLTRFKSQTIVEFIEKAIEHSRSGRYLFFLHRRPVLGPMRVQLLHPVSRFKHVQSLQHLCRFVIVKYVRRDLINSLHLPQRLKDYLNSPYYFFESVEQFISEIPPEQTTSSAPGPSNVNVSETSPLQFRLDSHSSVETSLTAAPPSYQISPSTLSSERNFTFLKKFNWKGTWVRNSDSHLASFFSFPSPYQSSSSESEQSELTRKVKSIEYLCDIQQSASSFSGHGLISALALETTMRNLSKLRQ